LPIRPGYSATSLNTMQSPNEPRRPAEARQDEGGAWQSGDAPYIARREAQAWKLSFVLFVLGFLLLVVVGKLNVSRLTTNMVRGVAAGLCVAAFVIARRAQRVRR
jgi:hypothetical protein